MGRFVPALVSSALVMFAALSSSTHYQLNNYSVGPGGTNNSSSTTYDLQATVGEQANGTANSTTYTGNNGSIQAEQLDVPLAPTLSNNSGAYYNQLNCIITTTNEPSDSTYAIAVSTNSFATTSYVQASGALGSSPVFQSYSTWGSGSGFQITGLTSNTTYQVKVSAMEGQFTNTAYGSYASAATGSPTITFSVSPNSASLGSFLPNTIKTSSNLSFTYATNATSGGDVYVLGKNNGFYSPSKSYTISAYSGNLTGVSQGFGIQATNPSETSGGPLTTVSPFNGTSNTVGAESTTLQPIFATTSSIVGGTANANIQVKAAGSAPTASDYGEVFTFVAAASF
jgi:hypothetical protein